MEDALAGAPALCDGLPDAALYFPRLAGADGPRVPCGAVAGVIHRTDVQRGVWKAPAGAEASLVGVRGLALTLTDQQLGALNPRAINGLRTLPYLKAWDERYRDRGLTIVGVHTPEFGFEKDTANVEDAIKRNELRYPVAQDNDYGTWDAWGFA